MMRCRKSDQTVRWSEIEAAFGRLNHGPLHGILCSDAVEVFLQQFAVRAADVAWPDCGANSEVAGEDLMERWDIALDRETIGSGGCRLGLCRAPTRQCTEGCQAQSYTPSDSLIVSHRYSGLYP